MRRRPLSRAEAAAVFLAALTCLLVPASGVAESPRRVGVVITLTVNVTEERALDVSGALGEAMSEELAVRAIAGADAAAALPEAGVQDGCIADDECVDELADRLAVDEILALVVVEVGEQIKIEPTWVDVAEGRRVSRAALAFDKASAPGELFRRRAHELLPGAERRPDAADDSDASEASGGAEGSEGSDGGSEADASDAAEPGAGDEGRAPDVDSGAGKGAFAEPATGEDGRPQLGTGRRMTPAAWTAAGIGVAALSGGVIFGLATRGLYQSCENDDCDGGEGKRITRRALTADALFVTAAISGGVAAFLYWRSDSDRERDVSVGAGPGDIGLSVGGRF